MMTGIENDMGYINRVDIGQKEKVIYGVNDE
jgi:hypothetical protein